MKVILGLVATVFILALALVPTWIFLWVRSIANPDGFWQNLAVFGIGFWLLSGLQVFLLVFGVVFLLGAWATILDS